MGVLANRCAHCRGNTAAEKGLDSELRLFRLRCGREVGGEETRSA